MCHKLIAESLRIDFPFDLNEKPSYIHFSWNMLTEAILSNSSPGYEKGIEVNDGDIEWKTSQQMKWNIIL